MDQLPLPFDDGNPPWLAAGEFLTIAEAAERVRCNERTIRRAIDTGQLRAARVRGRSRSRGGYRIRPADLESWLFDEHDE
jgi:excisionase family DNA binding protein